MAAEKHSSDKERRRCQAAAKRSRKRKTGTTGRQIRQTRSHKENQTNDHKMTTVSSETRGDHTDPKIDQKQPNTSRRGDFRVSLSRFCVLMSQFVGVLVGNIDRLSSG